MDSKTRFSDSLADVSSVSASSYDTVVFTLKKEDPYFINQLDFPIFKRNSDKKTSSDNLEIPPISSGAYTVDETKLKLDLILQSPTSDKYYSINVGNYITKEDIDSFLNVFNAEYIKKFYEDL